MPAALECDERAANGLIATNFHVIGEGRPIAVELADGSKVPPAGFEPALTV